MKRLIIIDNDIPFIKGVLEPYFNVRYITGSQITSSDIINACALIVRTRTKCNKMLLEGSSVELIASATIGTDHIDEKYCSQCGIEVDNAPGCNSSAVMQYFFTALYALAEEKHISLKDKTIGVIGVGHVGSKIAALGKKLGFNILLNDPPKEKREGKRGIYSNLALLLQESDIVTLHIPLWKENVDFADDVFFSNMKKSSIFINASRGEVVDENAMLRHFGNFSGTVIDVWKNEPDINRDMLGMVDIATPHIAGYSLQGKENGTTAVIRTVGEHFGIEQLKDFRIETKCCSLKYRGLSQNELAAELLSIYDIRRDVKDLRDNPDLFEKLRKEYEYRDEFYIE